MIQVAGKPLVSHTIDGLLAAGVEKIIVNTHYKADILTTYIKTKYDQVNILFSHEPELLESGGGIVNALPHFYNAPFYLANADIITYEPNVFKLLAQNYTNNMDALLLLIEKEKAKGYIGNGDFNLNSSKQLEKIDAEMNYVFGGISIFHPRLFERVEVRPFRLFDFLLKNEKMSNIHSIIYEGEWLHISTPNDIYIIDRQ